MNTLRLSIISGTALMGLTLIAPTFALAESATAQSSVTVAYADLNPANKQDAIELYARLQEAAKSVCAPYMVSEINQYAARKACYMRVLAKAVHDVREREISTLHARAIHAGRSTEQLASGGSASPSVSK